MLYIILIGLLILIKFFNVCLLKGFSKFVINIKKYVKRLVIKIFK